MKKIFLLTLIAVFATSSMAFAWAPYEANTEKVGAGKLEAGDAEKTKVQSDLSKETDSAQNMLKKADNKTGKGAAYDGSKSSGDSSSKK